MKIETKNVEVPERQKWAPLTDAAVAAAGEWISCDVEGQGLVRHAGSLAQAINHGSIATALPGQFEARSSRGVVYVRLVVDQ